jgi:hypothetical protein
MDIMKSINKLNVKNVVHLVPHVPITLIVLFVNGTDKKIVNQIAHAQPNNTQMKTVDVNLVTILVQNVLTHMNAHYVMSQEL